MTYSSSNSLRRLLEDLVKQPFENHPQTPAWVDQVINTSYEYHAGNLGSRKNQLR